MSRMGSVFCGLVFLGVTPVIAATTPKELADHHALLRQESHPHAVKALTTLNTLVTEENFKRMGFVAKDEVKKAQLGEGLPVFLVRLDELQKYKPGDDPYKLLHRLDKVIYPVVVNDQVRSGIELSKIKGQWRPTSFGIPGSVQLFSKARLKHSTDAKTPASSYFLVQVPALNHYFLGQQAAKELLLVPVLANADHEFQVGVSLPAATVFAKLVPEAKAHQGNPR